MLCCERCCKREYVWHAYWRLQCWCVLSVWVFPWRCVSGHISPINTFLHWGNFIMGWADFFFLFFYCFLLSVVNVLCQFWNLSICLGVSALYPATVKAHSVTQIHLVPDTLFTRAEPILLFLLFLPFHELCNLDPESCRLPSNKSVLSCPTAVPSVMSMGIACYRVSSSLAGCVEQKLHPPECSLVTIFL